MSAYLASNNLHFKPLTARLARELTDATTELQRSASLNQWHGHVVIFLSKAFFTMGAICSIPLALIETISSLASGIILGILNRSVYQDRSEFLQKYALKAISYGCHSLTSSVALLVIGWKAPLFLYHTTNAIVDHALYLGSAALIQCSCGVDIDQAAGRNPNLAIERTIQLLGDSHPDLIYDVLNQFQRDFDFDLRDRLGALPHLRTFLDQHPDSARFIREFNFQSFLTSAAYRQQAVQILRQFLIEAQLLRPDVQELNPYYFELNQSNAAEGTYQEKLAAFLKAAFLEIYRTPRLANCLSTDKETGQSLLESFDASICAPLATYTQYKELLQPLTCPSHFTQSLRVYNDCQEKEGRYRQLQSAKTQVDLLTNQQKGTLVEKILKGDLEVEPAVQEVYKKIGELAGPLYQGPLMTKTAIDLSQIDSGNIIVKRNLFQKACQEALAEIAQAPAAV